MFDYFRPQEFIVEHLWFHFEEEAYFGSGVMLWQPGDHFQVIAPVNRAREEPWKREIKALSIVNPVCVYMRLKNGVRAMAPGVLPSAAELSLGNFSVRVRRVIFFQPSPVPKSKFWSGLALFEIPKGIAFSDTVSVETRIGAAKPLTSQSLAGIYFEDESGKSVRGYVKNDGFLELGWSLPTGQWTKSQGWYYGESLQHAISMLSGTVLRLKYREMYRPKHIIREVRATDRPSTLGIIFRPYDHDALSKELVVEWADFLTQEELRAGIIRRIYDQMAEASRQHTRMGKEILLATILEAALRTIYDQPFLAKKDTDPFRLDHYLKKFQDDYLPGNDASVETKREWKKVRSRLRTAQKRLRDRNAHPDWLSSGEGAYSTSNLAQTSDDMIFLSRYYGYMMMALTGHDVSDPSFPEPLSGWKPMLTITKGKTSGDSGRA